jgi:hypothetical protein
MKAMRPFQSKAACAGSAGTPSFVFSDLTVKAVRPFRPKAARAGFAGTPTDFVFSILIVKSCDLSN